MNQNNKSKGSVMQEYFEKNRLKNNSENRSSYVADLLRKGEQE